MFFIVVSLFGVLYLFLLTPLTFCSTLGSRRPSCLTSLVKFTSPRIAPLWTCSPTNSAATWSMWWSTSPAFTGEKSYVRTRSVLGDECTPFCAPSEGVYLSVPSVLAGSCRMAAAVPMTRSLWLSSGSTTRQCFIWKRSQSSSRSSASSERRALRGKVCSWGL